MKSNNYKIKMKFHNLYLIFNLKFIINYDNNLNLNTFKNTTCCPKYQYFTWFNRITYITNTKYIKINN